MTSYIQIEKKLGNLIKKKIAATLEINISGRNIFNYNNKALIKIVCIAIINSTPQR